MNGRDDGDVTADWSRSPLRRRPAVAPRPLPAPPALPNATPLPSASPTQFQRGGVAGVTAGTTGDAGLRESGRE